MTAYELAYKLNNALGVDYEMLEQSSIMLRQQADRIAELEKFNKAILKKGGYPHKPLTDEEIEDLAGYAGENPTKSDMIAFARAIEERHGIK